MVYFFSSTFYKTATPLFMNKRTMYLICCICVSKG